MKKLGDVVNESGYVSLAKLTGKQVVDLLGFIDGEHGFPAFQPWRVDFADGTCGHLDTDLDSIPSVVHLPESVISREQLDALEREDLANENR